MVVLSFEVFSVLASGPRQDLFSFRLLKLYLHR